MNDKDDGILLDKIERLESELAESKRRIRKLRSPSRIFKPFKDTWAWWTDPYKERVANTIGVVVVTLMFLGVVWLFGGWSTDAFYIDSCPCNHSKYGVYQEYSWGKDLKVESCGDIDQCANKLEKHRSSWLKHKDIIGAP